MLLPLPFSLLPLRLVYWRPLAMGTGAPATPACRPNADECQRGRPVLHCMARRTVARATRRPRQAQRHGSSSRPERALAGGATAASACPAGVAWISSSCTGWEPGARLSRAGRGAAQARKTKLTSVAHLAVREAAGPNCRKGRRVEEIRGSEDISRGFADSASPCQAVVSCHVSQSGKNVRTGATGVLNM